MSKAKKLYLVRHGQTLFNLSKKIQGWCDSPLTELGIYQAKVASNYFKKNKIDFDFVYSSTSERASNTLEIITNKRYMVEKGLKEWNFGELEGESESLNPPLPYGNFFKEYGGEGEEEFKDRVTTTIKKIMDRNDHNSVLIVSHGAACAQFYRNWLNYNKVIKNNARFYNCCILEYEYKDGIFSLINLLNEEIKKISTDNV